MRIGGFHPFSLSDYPGNVAAIMFCQGCNFRCPWCHNRQLISHSSPQGRLIPVETVLARLRHLHGRLDGVVVTGGEPTIQDDLPNFLGQLIALGLAVKLDTNGSRPEVLRPLLENKLLNYVAMDVKAPPEMYSRVAGVDVSMATIENSIQIITDSGVDHEFRTTAISILSPIHLRTIATMLPRHSRYRVQPCHTPIES